MNSASAMWQLVATHEARLSRVRVLVLLLLLAAMVWLVTDELLPASKNLEKEVRMRWGPLTDFDLPTYLSFDQSVGEQPVGNAVTSVVTAPLQAVIYMLVRVGTQQEPELHRSLRMLHDNFNAQAKYPLLLFYEPPNAADAGEVARTNEWQRRLLLELSRNQTKGTQCARAWNCVDGGQPLHAHLNVTHNRYGRAPFPWESELCHLLTPTTPATPLEVRPCLPWRVVFVEYLLDFPDSFTATEREHFSNPSVPLEWDTSCKPLRLTYRHMCRFMSLVQYHPLLAAFDWYWRLDDDSELLAPLPYDPFALLETRHKSFGWVVLDHEYSRCAAYLPEHINQYRQQLLQASNDVIAGADFIHRHKNVVMFYNNFELGRFDFWRRPEVRDFLAWMESTRGTYRWRWGDAPIRTAALSLFLPSDQFLFLADVTYRHELLVNHPEASFEKRVWRFLLSEPAGLPREFSFRWLSWALFPLLLILPLVAMAKECRLKECHKLIFKSRWPTDSQVHIASSEPRELLKEWPHWSGSHFIRTHPGEDAAKSSPSVRSRLVAVDVLCCISILATVFTHCITKPQLERTHGRVEIFLRDVTSFAVPSFIFLNAFMASQSPWAKWQLFSGMVRRFLIPYLIASILALLCRWLDRRTHSEEVPLAGGSGWFQVPMNLLLGCPVEVL